jgi:hypothetical protein
VYLDPAGIARLRRHVGVPAHHQQAPRWVLIVIVELVASGTHLPGLASALGMSVEQASNVVTEFGSWMHSAFGGSAEAVRGFEPDTVGHDVAVAAGAIAEHGDTDTVELYLKCTLPVGITTLAMCDAVCRFADRRGLDGVDLIARRGSNDYDPVLAEDIVAAYDLVEQHRRVAVSSVDAALRSAPTRRSRRALAARAGWVHPILADTTMPDCEWHAAITAVARYAPSSIRPDTISALQHPQLQRLLSLNTVPAVVAEDLCDVMLLEAVAS